MLSDTFASVAAIYTNEQLRPNVFSRSYKCKSNYPNRDCVWRVSSLEENKYCLFSNLGPLCLPKSEHASILIAVPILKCNVSILTPPLKCNVSILTPPLKCKVSILTPPLKCNVSMLTHRLFTEDPTPWPHPKNESNFWVHPKGAPLKLQYRFWVHP